MPIITCPKCSATLEVDAESAGANVQCGNCQHVFTAQFSEQSPPRRASRDEVEERPSRRPSRRRDYDDEDDYDRRPSRRQSRDGGGTQGMGIASLVCGILGILGSCCCGLFGSPLDIIAIILGVLALKTPGRGMGITGIICGVIGLIVMVVSIIFAVGMQGANGGAGGNPFKNFR